MDETLFPHLPSAPLALIIDLEALSHNYRTLCAHLSPSTLCAAVLKADSYGIGAKKVASRLYQEGCRHFFMAYLSEALEIKSYVGEGSFIYVLAGLPKGEEDIYEESQIIPILGHKDQIFLWNALGQRKNKCLPAALHIDTGMTRTGFLAESVQTLNLVNFSHIELKWIISHLVCAYQDNHPSNDKQRQIFDALRQAFFPIPTSLSSSGGISLGKAYHYDMVRPGLALTGCKTVNIQCLKPVLKAYAQVLHLNFIPSGTSIGYDKKFTVGRPSLIATIGVGYADGYFRSLSNRGEVYFKGRKFPIVGNVSMDMLTIDVTGHPLQIGDWVELFGDNLPAHKLAEQAGTISWELFTRLGRRFERFYIGC